MTLCLHDFKHFNLSAKVLNFLLNAVCSTTKCYQPILLIFDSKHWHTPEYLAFKFGENRSKIASVRVLQCKNAKWTPSRHQIRIFKNRENNLLIDICQIICGRFHQNGLIRLGSRDDIHTYACTYIHKP